MGVLNLVLVVLVLWSVFEGMSVVVGKLSEWGVLVWEKVESVVRFEKVWWKECKRVRRELNGEYLSKEEELLNEEYLKGLKREKCVCCGYECLVDVGDLLNGKYVCGGCECGLELENMMELGLIEKKGGV